MIFLYHRVVADGAPAQRMESHLAISAAAFQRHLGWLATRFRIVTLEEYVAAPRGSRWRLAAITFDDGDASTWHAVRNALRERNIPITIFLATAHLATGDPYWFAYLDALCYESGLLELEWNGSRYRLDDAPARRETRRQLGQAIRRSTDPGSVARAMSQRYALDPSLHEAYRSMTTAEVRDAVQTGLVSIGSHSVTHPYLDGLPQETQEREMTFSREMLAQIAGSAPRFFAYPGGAYDRAAVLLARKAGYDAAFACTPNRPITDPTFERPRVGIYSGSLPKLAAKSFGAAQLLRSLDVAAG